jgi:hypothetical protein
VIPWLRRVQSTSQLNFSYAVPSGSRSRRWSPRAYHAHPHADADAASAATTRAPPQSPGSARPAEKLCDPAGSGGI